MSKEFHWSLGIKSLFITFQFGDDRPRQVAGSDDA